MQPGQHDAYFSIPGIQEVRGIESIEPELQATLTVDAAGFPDGASVLILVRGNLAGSSGRHVDLGTAAPIMMQVGWPPPRTTSEPPPETVEARWRISPTGVERLEQMRNGDGVTVSVSVRYALLGAAPEDWDEPHRPIRVPYPRQPNPVALDAHQWARDVMQPWQQAAAISLVVPLPQAGVTDEHRTIVARLSEAKRQLDAGQWVPSIEASRQACDLLRKMAPQH